MHSYILLFIFILFMFHFLEFKEMIYIHVIIYIALFMIYLVKFIYSYYYIYTLFMCHFHEFQEMIYIHIIIYIYFIYVSFPWIPGNDIYSYYYISLLYLCFIWLNSWKLYIFTLLYERVFYLELRFVAQGWLCVFGSKSWKLNFVFCLFLVLESVHAIVIFCFSNVWLVSCFFCCAYKND